MTWKRLLGRSLTECAAIGRAIAGPPHGLRILLYHSVGSDLHNDAYGISIAPELFERHIALLTATERVQVVDLQDAPSSAAPLRVAVTFDDGYKDNLYRAAPILLRYGVPFTVFVTTTYIQNKSREYLSVEELKELAGLPGVTIGSHGATHIHLTSCSDATLWHEVTASREYLQEVLQKPVHSIAYPHGSTDRRVADAARRAGYILGVCSRFGVNGPSRDPLFLCRTELVAADTERVFLQKLYGDWDWYRWRARDPVRT